MRDMYSIIDIVNEIDLVTIMLRPSLQTGDFTNTGMIHFATPVTAHLSMMKYGNLFYRQSILC